MISGPATPTGAFSFTAMQQSPYGPFSKTFTAAGNPGDVIELRLGSFGVLFGTQESILDCAAASPNPLLASTTIAPSSFTTHYTAAETARLGQIAAYLGVSRSQVQKIGVYALAWIVAVVKPPAEPLNAPDLTGPTAVTTTWSTAELPALTFIRIHFGLGPEAMQKVGMLFVSFVVALSGH